MNPRDLNMRSKPEPEPAPAAEWADCAQVQTQRALAEAVKLVAEANESRGRQLRDLEHIAAWLQRGLVAEAARLKGVASEGPGAAVAAVAVHAAVGLLPASWTRAREGGPAYRMRWVGYALCGAVAAATIGPWLVVVLLACGALEVAMRPRRPSATSLSIAPVPMLALGSLTAGSLSALIWMGLKVGALSYGGGFVIVPLMQNDAVNVHGWMTGGQFLNAVALGQITPGPVVHTVAVVGYAAAGLFGGVLAALVAFSPSFLFVLIGAPYFDRLRASPDVRRFLDGAGPAAIGAIGGSAITLARTLTQPWQYVVLALASVLLLPARRGVVMTLLAAGFAGIIAVGAGLPLPH